MSLEFEQSRRYRVGESANRAHGGSVAEVPRGPLRKWFIEFAQKKRVSLKEITREVGLTVINDLPGVSTMSEILQTAPQVFNLSEEETQSLSEAVAETLRLRLKKGLQTRKGLHPSRVRKLKEGVVCKVYTPSEAAVELCLTREGVRQLRREFGYGLLMTEEQVDSLRKENRIRRRRQERFEEEVRKLREKAPL